MPAPEIHAESVFGTIGGNWCFSKNQYGVFTFELYVEPFDPDHEPTANELFTTLLANIWRTLSPSQKSAWSKLGRKYKLPLYNAFLKTNYIRRRAGLPITNTPD
jgi:hypothetical protein